jgi:hypothetical protein
MRLSRPIATNLLAPAGLDKSTMEQFASRTLGKIPLKRFGRPEEVAKLAAFYPAMTLLLLPALNMLLMECTSKSDNRVNFIEFCIYESYGKNIGYKASYS